MQAEVFKEQQNITIRGMLTKQVQGGSYANLSTKIKVCA
jgi:hypothetical protein